MYVIPHSDFMSLIGKCDATCINTEATTAHHSMNDRYTRSGERLVKSPNFFAAFKSGAIHVPAIVCPDVGLIKGVMRAKISIETDKAFTKVLNSFKCSLRLLIKLPLARSKIAI